MNQKFVPGVRLPIINGNSGRRPKGTWIAAFRQSITWSRGNGIAPEYDSIIGTAPDSNASTSRSVCPPIPLWSSATINEKVDFDNWVKCSSNDWQRPQFTASIRQECEKEQSQTRLRLPEHVVPDISNFPLAVSWLIWSRIWMDVVEVVDGVLKWKDSLTSRSMGIISGANRHSSLRGNICLNSRSVHTVISDMWTVVWGETYPKSWRSGLDRRRSIDRCPGKSWLIRIARPTGADLTSEDPSA